MKIFSRIAIILFIVLGVFGLFSPIEVLAQADGLQAIGDQTGLGDEDIRIVIARIIRVFLSILGVLATVMVVYAGFLWMTSAGNPEKVEKAKKILINGVIGLIIIFASIAIVSFIMGAILGATGSRIDGTTGGSGGGGGFGGPGASQMVVAGFRPQGDVPIRNVVANVVFSRDVDENTIADAVQVFDRDTAENIPVNLELSSNRTISIRPQTACPEPHEDRFCFDEDINIRVTISQSIRSTTGQVLVCSPIYPCSFEFGVGNLIDTSPPSVIMITPSSGQRISPLLDSVPVQVRVIDDSQASHADFLINEAQFDSVTAEGENLSDVFIHTFWNATTVEQNTNHRITVKAFDIAGNEAERSVIIRVNPAHCYNNRWDSDLGETGVDCGGDCGACTGNFCNEDADCAVGRCVDNICTPLPEITEVDPPGGAIGTYTLIRGRLFGSSQGRVFFTGIDDTEVEANIPPQCQGWSSTEVLVEIPEGAIDGPIRLETAGGLSTMTDGEDSNKRIDFDVNDVRRPNLCAVSPRTTNQGARITLTGSGFGEEREGSFVNFTANNASHIDASNYIRWTDAEVEVVVPNIEQDDYLTRVTVDGETSNPITLFIRGVDEIEFEDMPNISAILPENEGARGDYITIEGSGFGTLLGQVIFTNVSTGESLQGSVDFPRQCSNDDIWSPSQAIVRVPQGADIGEYDISLTRTDGAVSNTVNFTVVNRPARPGICALDPDIGMEGDEVDIFGNNLGSANGQVLFGSRGGVDDGVLADIESWGSSQVSVIAPDADTGRVYLRNSAGDLSNPLNFTYGIDDRDEFEEESILGGYGWTFSTGELPIVPELIVACTQDPRSLSAVPNVQFNSTSCVNVKAVAEFNVAMDHGSFTNNVSVHTCNNSGCTRLGDDITNDTRFNIVSSEGNETRFEILYIGNSEGHWPANTRILVEVNGGDNGVVSSAGEKMVNDARWIFETGDANDVCEIEEVVIAPSKKIFKEKGEEANFNAMAVARQCLVINDGSIEWAWGMSSVGIASIQGDCQGSNTDECRVVRADMDGRTDLEATARMDSADNVCTAIIDINNQIKDIDNALEENRRANIALGEEFEDSEEQERLADLIEENNRIAGELSNALTELRDERSSFGVGEGEWFFSSNPSDDLLDNGICGTKTSVPGSAEIIVDFQDPYIQAFRPNCGEACLNAGIGARFNIPVKTDGKHGLGYQDNIILEKCNNQLCSFPERILIEDIVCNLEEKNNLGDEGCLDFSIALSESTLLSSTYYRVTVSNRVQSLSHKPLARLTDPSSFVWMFRTGDNICAIENILVNPRNAMARAVGDRQVFTAIPLGPPDSCSEAGQRLNAYNYNWNWTKPITEEANVAEWLKMSGRPGSEGFIEYGVSSLSGCTDRCLPIGSQPRVAVCGNGILERGEECDPGNSQGGDGCSASCLREPWSVFAEEVIEVDENSEEEVKRNDFGNAVYSFGRSEVSCGDGVLDRFELIRDSNGEIVPGPRILDGVTQEDANDTSEYPYGWIGEECDPGPDGDWSGCDRTTCMNLGARASGLTCGDNDVAWSADRGGLDCDDGNRANGDGCSAQCLNEGSMPMSQSTPAVCGDGEVTAPWETCDPGKEGQEWCPSNCLKPGLRVAERGQTCADGLDIGWAECDPEVDPEGCTTDCLFRGSSLSYSEPSVCGDGVTGIGEHPSCEVAVGNGEFRVAPGQIAQIASTAPRQVNQSTGEARATIRVSAEEAVGVIGEAFYRLSCSARTYQDCSNPDEYGVGIGNCCAPRPEIETHHPGLNASGVCRNILPSFTTNIALDEGSIGENIRLIYNGEGCPDGHIREDVRTTGFTWIRVLTRNIVPNAIAQDAGVCVIPVSRVQYNENEGSESSEYRVSIYTGRALAGNSDYTLEIKGDDNLDDDVFVGLASHLMVRMNGTRRVDFTTSNEICEINKIDVRDPDGDPEGFFGSQNDSRNFSARALAISGGIAQEIQPIDGVYSWTWQDWREHSGGNVVRVANSNDNIATIEAGNESGRTFVVAGVEIDDTPDEDGNNRRVFSGLEVTAFFCENPWPDAERGPFMDSLDSGSPGAAEGRFWTNFAFYYCRDVADGQDLPSLTARLAPGITEGIQKEYIFEVGDNSGDAIGIRIAGNPNYLTPMEWYRDQGFTGSPTSLQVSGLPAVQDGRTLYIAAPNQQIHRSQDSDEMSFDIYPNIYIISHNQLASEGTRNIFTQIVDNFELMANIPNERLCIAGTNQGEVCNTNSDCGVGGICGNNRDQLTRDFVRIGDMINMSARLDNYARENGICSATQSQSCSNDAMCPSGETCMAVAPRLESGTFIPGMSASTWPSWSENLGQLIGGTVVDPLNIYGGECDGDSVTCFNADNLTYSCSENSYVYHYLAKSGGRYELVADLEYAGGLWGYEADNTSYGDIRLSYPDRIVDEYSQYLISSIRAVDSGNRVQQDSSTQDSFAILNDNTELISSIRAVDSGNRVQQDSSTQDSFAILNDNTGQDRFSNRGTQSVDDKMKSGFTRRGDNMCSGQVFGESSACGDGILGPGQQCEPGVFAGYEPCTTDNGVHGRRERACNSDSCTFEGNNTNECIPFACGNGVVDPGEECDDGPDNGRYGFCGIDCTYKTASFCGDGKVSAGEVCDLGVDNNGSYELNASDTCAWDCRGPGPHCGDGIVQTEAGEQCDGGVETDPSCDPARVCVSGNSSKIGQACDNDSDCDSEVRGQKMGDGMCSRDVVERHKVRSCGADCKWESGWSSCIPVSTCGDGVVDPGEECDDGNRNNNDACTNDCRWNVCGDGILHEGVEQCDMGELNGVPCEAPYGGTCTYCSSQCRLVVNTGAFCGDGEWNVQYEFCDGGETRFAYVRPDGSRDGTCLPSEAGAMKDNGAICMRAGLCNGGSRNGQIVVRYETYDDGVLNIGSIPGTHSDFSSCPSGSVVWPNCNNTCTAACPFTYRTSSVALRGDMAGSGLTNDLTMVRESEADSVSNISSAGEIVFPACTVAAGMIGDVSVSVDRPNKALVHFVLDFSGSMRLSLGNSTRMAVMMESLREGINRLYDEMGDNVEVRITVYGPKIEDMLPEDSRGDYKDIRNEMSDEDVYKQYLLLHHSHQESGNFGYQPSRFEHAFALNKGYRRSQRNILMDHIDELETTFVAMSGSPATPSKIGFTTGSYLLEKDWENKGNNRNDYERILVFMTDGLFSNRENRSDNPFFSACRAEEKGQSIYTLALLNATQDGQQYISNLQSALGGSLCAQLRAENINPTSMPDSYLATANDRNDCTPYARALDVSGPVSVIDHMACMSSGNPDPISGIRYAHSGRNATEFAEAFRQLINSILGINMNIRVGGNEVTVGLREGVSVPIPLPTGFVCNPNSETVYPFTLAYTGSDGGTVRISNLRLSHCTQ